MDVTINNVLATERKRVKDGRVIGLSKYEGLMVTVVIPNKPKFYEGRMKLILSRIDPSVKKKPTKYLKDNDHLYIDDGKGGEKQTFISGFSVVDPSARNVCIPIEEIRIRRWAIAEEE